MDHDKKRRQEDRKLYAKGIGGGVLATVAAPAVVGAARDGYRAATTKIDEGRVKLRPKVQDAIAKKKEVNARVNAAKRVNRKLKTKGVGVLKRAKNVARAFDARATKRMIDLEAKLDRALEL